MPSQFLSWLRQKLGCADDAATSDLPAPFTDEKTSTALTPTVPEDAPPTSFTRTTLPAKAADSSGNPAITLPTDAPLAPTNISPTTPDIASTSSPAPASTTSAPSTPGPASNNSTSLPPPAASSTQQPIFENRPDGSAHVEFSGKQLAEKSNVNYTQKAETALTAWIHETDVSGKGVSSRFHGEQSADVRYQNANLEAKEEDLNLYIKGGKSKWIVGQTKDAIGGMKRGALLKLWETYRMDGPNQSIKGIDAEVLKEDYDDTPEGLAELREFITGYLAVSNGEEAG